MTSTSDAARLPLCTFFVFIMGLYLPDCINSYLFRCLCDEHSPLGVPQDWSFS